jgi:hypothetical protein
MGVVLVAGIFGALAVLAAVGWARQVLHDRRAAPVPDDPWRAIRWELESTRVADDPLIPDNREPRRP